MQYLFIHYMQCICVLYVSLVQYNVTGRKVTPVKCKPNETMRMH